MDSTTAHAYLLINDATYVSLPRRPDVVRELLGEAASAIERLAHERGRILAETPRLVDQRAGGIGLVRLEFQADTVKR